MTEQDPWEAPPTAEERADIDRYDAALHAMQSGVAYEMGVGDRHAATEPKHLRVGVNSAMVENSALARLLVRKGIITRAEFFKGIADAMEEEVRTYEARAPKGVTFK